MLFSLYRGRMISVCLAASQLLVQSQQLWCLQVCHGRNQLSGLMRTVERCDFNGHAELLTSFQW